MLINNFFNKQDKMYTEIPFFNDPMALFTVTKFTFTEYDSDVVKINVFARNTIYIAAIYSLYIRSVKPMFFAILILFLLYVFYVYKTRRVDKLPTIIDTIGQSKRNKKYSNHKLTHSEFNNMQVASQNNTNDMNGLVSQNQFRRRGNHNRQDAYDNLTSEVNNRIHKRTIGNYVY